MGNGSGTDREKVAWVCGRRVVVKRRDNATAISILACVCCSRQQIGKEHWE